MSGTIQSFFDFLKFLYLRRSPSMPFIKVGIFLIGSALSVGFFFDVNASYGPLTVSLDGSDRQTWPLVIQWLMFGAGFPSLIVGLIVQWRQVKTLWRDAQRKRLVTVEHRGLTTPINGTLSSSVPPEFIGRREEIFIDQTPYVSGNSRVDDPEKSLEEVLYIRRDIDGRVKAVDKKDVTVIYGGLASVPFTFLAGYLIDDDNEVEVMDWDRFKGKWFHIKAKGREAREAAISGVEEAGAADEVVVALSISYKADLLALAKVFPEFPLVHMDSGDYQPNNHWDREQQDRWADQFVTLMRALAGARKIHLTIAAQNSVVFTLGRNFDRRNSPAINLYQYERDEDPAYPWAVAVPRGGNDAQIIWKSDGRRR
ncbi:SAVED domain-containing protein [Kordiimonas sp.]|uniref:SAVED domain-containing protein n=1 Tax=Kordiimonas sp. TaxID=1970157 RepID=UPI003B518DD0